MEVSSARVPSVVAGEPSVASQVATPEGPASAHTQRAGENVPWATTVFSAGSTIEIDGGVRSMLTFRTLSPSTWLSLSVAW